jgi:hypothetical protein
MHSHVAALHNLARGLGAPKGLGIQGPYGPTLDTKGSALDGGPYEISGTQVSLHDPNINPSSLAPSVGVIGYFNNKYGDNGGKIVGTPDTVVANGQVANANGYTWAQVTVDGGELNGKTGYVALKYLAPRGWTASHGGTVSVPPAVVDPNKPADEGDQPTSPSGNPPAAMTGEPSAAWKPWLIGGLAVLGAGGILYALFGTKGGKQVRRRAKAHRRLRRIRRRRR